MKKLGIIFLAIILTVGIVSGCEKKETGKEAENNKAKNEVITVGASPVPHGKILEYAKKYLKEEGYELKIIEFTDYVQPNKALVAKELDANYFQHQPYLDDYNQKNKTDILGLAGIHYEPLGLYGGKEKSLDKISKNGKIGVPNDGSNEARALLLLEKAGFIKLKKGVGVQATVKDITENYALDAGLSVENDALLIETSDSVGATQYQNVIAVRKEDKDSKKIKTSIEVLTSKKVKNYINDSFEHAVVAK